MAKATLHSVSARWWIGKHRFLFSHPAWDDLGRKKDKKQIKKTKSQWPTRFGEEDNPPVCFFLPQKAGRSQRGWADQPLLGWLTSACSVWWFDIIFSSFFLSIWDDPKSLIICILFHHISWSGLNIRRQQHNRIWCLKSQKPWHLLIPFERSYGKSPFLMGKLTINDHFQ